MAKLLIVYGTTEGQTRKIADHMAARARERGFTPDLVDSADPPPDLRVAAFDAVMVAASLHAGQHQTSVERFVRTHLADLCARPAAFVSVSLSAGGDARDRTNAQDCLDRFTAQTGWRPTFTHLTAGALRYSRYGFIKRQIMRLIARSKGAPTDPHHDVEFTDWDDLRRFTDAFLDSLSPSAAVGRRA